MTRRTSATCSVVAPRPAAMTTGLAGTTRDSTKVITVISSRMSTVQPSRRRTYINIYALHRRRDGSAERATRNAQRITRKAKFISAP